MGWMVEIDQNLTGTFLPALTGTNLTFVNNTLPLTFGSSGGSSFVFQDPQSPVSIFSQPNPLQVVAVGSPVSVGVTVSGCIRLFNGVKMAPQFKMPPTRLTRWHPQRWRTTATSLRW
jgi:hypothetical protein